MIVFLLVVILGANIVSSDVYGAVYNGTALNYFGGSEVFQLDTTGVYGQYIRPTTSGSRWPEVYVEYGFPSGSKDWLAYEILGRVGVASPQKPEWYYGVGVPLENLKVRHPLFDPSVTEAFLSIATGMRNAYTGLLVPDPNYASRWIVSVYDRSNPYLPELLLWGELPGDFPIGYWSDMKDSTTLSARFFQWFDSQASWDQGILKIQGVNLPVTITAVPVPGAAFLFVSGIVSLAMLRRKNIID